MCLFLPLQASLKGGVCDANKPYMRYKLTDDGTPISNDVDFDQNEDNLYVMTGKTVRYRNFPIFLESLK